MPTPGRSKLISRPLRAVYVLGRRLVLDTARCRDMCCGGGCALWRPLVQCSNPSACFDGTPPPPPVVYICATVRCSNGEELRPGMRVFLDERCWTVGIGTVPNPPIDQRVKGLSSVLCVERCDLPPCPTGELYYPTVPCEDGVEPIWVCGVTGCEVRGCHVIRPVGGVPLSQVPPGAVRRRAIDLGPPRTTCCACGPNGEPAGECTPNPLVPDPGTDPCFPEAPRGQTCCCQLNPSTGLFRTRMRLTNWHTRQVRNGGFPVNTGTSDARITAEIPVPGAPSCVTYRAHVINDGFARPHEELDGTVGYQFCGQCGWPLIAPRLLFVAIDGQPPSSQVIAGSEGIEWGASCRGYDERPQGGALLERLQFTSSYSCRAMTQRAIYRYTFGATTIVTTFEFAAQLILPGGVDPCGAPCGGRINGGIVQDPGSQPPDVPPGGAGTGCAGCGAGQQRTPV